MKLTLFLALFLVVFVAYIQGQSCPGAPPQYSCEGGRDLGRYGVACRPRQMWYYDSADRTCKRMQYRGCRGNWNRHCSEQDCQRGCVRR